MSQVSSFIKIGKVEHLNSLKLQGELRFPSFEELRKNEESEARKDINEGIESIEKHNDGKLLVEIDGAFEEVAQMNEFTMTTHISGLGVYCCFAVTPEMIDKPLPEALHSFEKEAPHAAIINPKTFIERLKSFRTKNNSKMTWDLVQYENDQLRNEFNPFRKHPSYAWQSEFRICIEDELLDANRKIYLGDLSDSVSIFPIPSDGRRLKLERAKGAEAS